jgi:DNA-directed RNA polymerase sigma subunit (sigma70/sigma32)
MTPEEFIKRHPFPSNGAQINDILVKDIQDPSKSDKKEANLQKLLENNARLIYLIYYQYNYNQSLASVMSFTYEGLCKATETYDPDIGMPFYHYAMQTTRGLLQNWYNYNNDLIHVPVMKKKEVNIDYSDLNVYNEYQDGSNMGDMEAFVQPHEENATIELDALIEVYEGKGKLNDQSKKDLEILKLSRNYNIKDLSKKLGINTSKLKFIITRCVGRMRKFALHGVEHGNKN